MILGLFYANKRNNLLCMHLLEEFRTKGEQINAKNVKRNETTRRNEMCNAQNMTTPPSFFFSYANSHSGRREKVGDSRHSFFNYIDDVQ
jgi:hypothetical protein